VPVCFYEAHKSCLHEGRFFDAQDFVFNISKRRYRGLKKDAKLHQEQIEKQYHLYGLFPYSEGLGPDFDSYEALPVEIW
jgi:hypothetical protein